jgi:hypothetical protein
MIPLDCLCSVEGMLAAVHCAWMLDAWHGASQYLQTETRRDTGVAGGNSLNRSRIAAAGHSGRSTAQTTLTGRDVPVEAFRKRLLSRDLTSASTSDHPPMIGRSKCASLGRSWRMPCRALRRCQIMTGLRFDFTRSLPAHVTGTEISFLFRLYVFSWSSECTH